MTYYQFIRLCLLVDAAGMAGTGETIKNVIGRVKTNETQVPENAEDSEQEKRTAD